MEYTNARDWAEFEDKFPGAASWLRKRSLRREYECLSAEYVRIKSLGDTFGLSYELSCRYTWLKRRLHELSELYSGE